MWHLIYPKLLAGFGMLVSFINFSLVEFQDRFLALFCLFSVVTASDGSGSHRKVIKESHYYSVNDGVPQDTLIGPTFFIHK